MGYLVTLYYVVVHLSLDSTHNTCQSVVCTVCHVIKCNHNGPKAKELPSGIKTQGGRHGQKWGLTEPDLPLKAENPVSLMGSICSHSLDEALKILETIDESSKSRWTNFHILKHSGVASVEVQTFGNLWSSSTVRTEIRGLWRREAPSSHTKTL